MTHEEYITQQRIKAVAIAIKILEERIGIVDGLRELVPLFKILGISNDDEIIFLKGVESDADEFPARHARQEWNEIALKEKDAEMNKYESEVKQDVIKVCHRFIQKYS